MCLLLKYMKIRYLLQTKVLCPSQTHISETITLKVKGLRNGKGSCPFAVRGRENMETWARLSPTSPGLTLDSPGKTYRSC